MTGEFPGLEVNYTFPVDALNPSGQRTETKVCDEDCSGCPQEDKKARDRCLARICKEAFDEPYKPDSREICGRALQETVKSVPFYREITGNDKVVNNRRISVTVKDGFYFDDLRKFPDRPLRLMPDPAKPANEIPLVCAHRFGPYTVAVDVIADGFAGGAQKSEPLGEEGHEGFRAYISRPAMVRLACSVSGERITRKSFDISAPQILLPHAHADWLVPTRDFFTNPTDSWTFSKGGFLTRHDHSVQSGAKTLVDTVTAPVRALMPSTTINTSVNSQPGRPDTTTTSVTSNSPPR